MGEDQFDFKSVSESNEELDFNRLIPCPHCKKPIPFNATMCLYCGEGVTTHKKSNWIVWTAIFLLIIFIVFYLFGR